MDPKLAELYGTNTVDENDIEKLAAAQLAEELGEGQELDINDLSPEDIEAMASEVLASEEGGGEDGDDAQEKLAEADYLGRVMAHAYVQELRGIEKTSSRSTQRHGAQTYTKGGELHPKKLTKSTQEVSKSLQRAGAQAEEKKRFGSPLKKGSNTGKGGPKSPLANLAKKEKEIGSVGGKARSALGRVGSKLKELGGKAGGAAKAAVRHVGKHADKYGPAGIIGLSGMAAAHHMKSKESSALDILAERQALEFLEANGIDINEVEEQEKNSSPEMEVLEDAVTQRAAEMLAEAGYSFEDDETDEVEE
jgi:hypothetical protein